jgi:hypothetical protein
MIREDLAWLRQQHEHFHHERQRCRLFLMEHQDRLQESAGVWHDTCSQEMARRYLGPFQESAGFTLECLQQQQELHGFTAGCLEQAGAHLEQAGQCSQRLQHYLDEAGVMFRNLDTTLNHALYEMDVSANHVSECDHLLSRAHAIAG